jgi:dissimilatory sulfite reductase (desulfoviridin) alpha/beta subunit
MSRPLKTKASFSNGIVHTINHSTGNAHCANILLNTANICRVVRLGNIRGVGTARDHMFKIRLELGLKLNFKR